MTDYRIVVERRDPVTRQWRQVSITDLDLGAITAEAERQARAACHHDDSLAEANLNGRCRWCGEDLWRGYHSLAGMRVELVRRGVEFDTSRTKRAELARLLDESESSPAATPRAAHARRPTPRAAAVRCVCGYGPTSEADLDEHCIAMASAGDESPHAEAH